MAEMVSVFTKKTVSELQTRIFFCCSNLKSWWKNALLFKIKNTFINPVFVSPWPTEWLKYASKLKKIKKTETFNAFRNKSYIYRHEQKPHNLRRQSKSFAELKTRFELTYDSLTVLDGHNSLMLTKKGIAELQLNNQQKLVCSVVLSSSSIPFSKSLKKVFC